ncbi:DMT family transporter [Thiofilum flexile]|uniref:DMT family transporter n=1 Tax=Thiofilum flexile TaxID=125627 RepID=UPI0003719431|nr:DMT family transporter [Thiofilum flexile]
MKNTLFLIVGGALFSLSGLVVAYSTMGPSAIGFYRMLFGALILFTVALYQRKVFFAGWKPIIYAGLAGVFLALDIYLWHHGIRLVGPGLSAILTNCQVFALALFGVVLFKEKLKWQYYLSIFTAFIGISLIVYKDWSLSAEYQYGVWLGLGSAVAYAVCVIFLKESDKLEKPLDPIARMVYLSASAAIFLLITSMIHSESLYITDTRNFLALLTNGILVQAIAWLMVAYAVPHIKASLVGLILLLEPILAYIVDVLFISHNLSLISIIGCFLTLLAVYIGSQYGVEKKDEAPHKKSFIGIKISELKERFFNITRSQI